MINVLKRVAASLLLTVLMIMMTIFGGYILVKCNCVLERLKEFEQVAFILVMHSEQVGLMTDDGSMWNQTILAESQQ